MTAAALGQELTLALGLSAFESARALGKVAIDAMLVEGNEQASQRPESDAAWAVLGLTFIQHKYEDLAAICTLEQKGETLTFKSEGGLSGGALAIAGLSSAVAVPAFQKYLRRAKTTEAIDQIDRIYKASAAYYSSPHVERETGNKIPCQFPRTVELTPARSCCDSGADKDGDGRCDVDVDTWSGETWAALNFAMHDQHQFQYAYTSNGLAGSDAKFTASAYGDLDCDGIYSTFERYGYGDESHSRGECSMKGSPAFFHENETE